MDGPVRCAVRGVERAGGARMGNRLTSAAGELTPLLTGGAPSGGWATEPRTPPRWIVFRSSVRKEQPHPPSGRGGAARLKRGGGGMGCRRQRSSGVGVSSVCCPLVGGERVV